MSVKKPALAALLVLASAALAVQLVPLERINLFLPPSPLSPPSTGDIAAPPQIEALLARACYDCHSNRTKWPWYSRVAPVSWLVVRDVALGRKELNFSEWRSYYPQTRRRKLQWMGRVLRERSMPPWAYRLMHPGARLNGAERAMLDRWIDAGIVAP
jgi:Haem-binding domain